MKVLITGSTGFLGSNLMNEFSKGKEHTPYAMLRQENGPHVINDPAFIKCIKLSKPDAIIHCAALADVERCQSHPNEAAEAHLTGTKNIVENLDPACRLIHISTDMVYHGLGPHKEEDAERDYPPDNTYGISKFHAEEIVQRHQNHLILRVNFFGYQKGLARWIIDSLESRKDINLYYDMMFSPLHVKTLSKIIRTLTEATNVGTLNLGSSVGASKLWFGEGVAKALDLQNRTIKAAKYSGIPRPYDTRMNTTKMGMTLGYVPNLRDEIQVLKEEYDAANASRAASAV